MSPESWRRLGGAAGVLVAALALASPTAADPLYAVVEGDRLVFSNTPSRGDSRPVRGFTSPPAVPAEVTLPPTRYDPFIDLVARETGLSPRLIKAVALVESGFNTHAVSRKGAGGLMQLMPGTARAYGVSDVFDPLANLRAGSTHLASLLTQFNGDLSLALAAYNAGAGAVRRHGGIPAYPETQAYVRKVHERLGKRLPRGRGAAAKVVSSTPDVRLLERADGSVLLAN